MTQEELWIAMRDAKHNSEGMPMGQPVQALATLGKDVTATIHTMVPGSGWQERQEVWPAGTRVRAVMSSRFGDVGITKNLEAVNGYDARIPCVEGDVWGKPDPDVLKDIELIPGWGMKPALK
jgi:hypothetical protein